MNHIFPLFLFILIVHCTNTFAQNRNANVNVSSNLPKALSEVKYWGYQIQGIDNQDAVDSLVSSHYDMLVLEPTRTDWSSDTKYFNTADMVALLKNSFASDGLHRKLVIAYIDIGEAEDWRWYWTWSYEWQVGQMRPSDWPDYIITHDPDGWSGNYPVAYWDSRWKDLIIYGNNQNSAPFGDYNSVIDEVIKDGFDGIYLDWVEAFEDKNVIAAADAAGKDPAEEMISFIQEMKQYAIARDSQFLIIQQNASALCEGDPELFNIINAIAQEEVWYGGDATDTWDAPSGYDFIIEQSQTEEYFYYLDQYLSACVPVFNCEYALNYSDSAYATSYAQGYIPYVTRRSLGKLTTTPPPGIFTDVNHYEDNDNFLTEYALYQSYPNPFNPTTVIKYSIPVVGTSHDLSVQLKVYDILGNEVATLVNKQQPAGSYSVKFSASNLSSGIYYYKLNVGAFTEVRKMMLIK